MKTGTRLPNGAIVLLEKSGVILAVQDSVQPFVTWRWDGERMASTMYGNYFRSISNAAKDFEERVEKQEQNNAA